MFPDCWDILLLVSAKANYMFIIFLFMAAAVWILENHVRVIHFIRAGVASEVNIGKPKNYTIKEYFIVPEGNVLMAWDN